MRSKVMEKQVGGEHYNKHMNLQTWDIVDEYDLNYYEGNSLKYILREKGDRIEDLGKAVHYLEKEIERLEADRDSKTPKMFKGTVDGYQYFDHILSEEEIDENYKNLLKDDEHQENIEKLHEDDTPRPIKVKVNKDGSIHVDCNGNDIGTVVDMMFNQS